MPSSVNLGDQLEAFVANAIRNGRYGSRSEVLREGVRLVQERERRLAALDAALAQGLADVEAGRVEDAGMMFDRLIDKYETMAAKSAA
jgi:antitoxin ParD1/3/4